MGLDYFWHCMPCSFYSIESLDGKDVGGLFNVYRQVLIQYNKRFKAIKCIVYAILSIPFIFLCWMIYDNERSHDVIGVIFVLAIPFLSLSLQAILKHNSKVGVQNSTIESLRDKTHVVDEKLTDNTVELIKEDIQRDREPVKADKKPNNIIFFAKKNNQRAENPVKDKLLAVHGNNEISFRYEDSDGDITTCNVVLHSVTAEYFTGMCLTRHAERTFRRDRVILFYGNSREILKNFKSSPKKRISKTTDKPKEQLSVCFLGFPDSERELLIALAKPYQLKVLKTVTKKLFAVITDDELSQVQEEKILENGTLIMNKNSFLHFLEVGEI